MKYCLGRWRIQLVNRDRFNGNTLNIMENDNLCAGIQRIKRKELTIEMKRSPDWKFYLWINISVVLCLLQSSVVMNADRERRTAWWQQLWWSIPPIRWSLWYTENKTSMALINRFKSVLHRTIESVTNRKQLNWTGLKSDAKCCKSKLFCYSKYGQLPKLCRQIIIKTVCSSD